MNEIPPCPGCSSPLCPRGLPVSRPLDEPGVLGQNTGHGHVFPRPDGARARCGGPRLCWRCREDAAALEEAGVEALAVALRIVTEDQAAEHACAVREALALQGWTITPLRGDAR